MSAGTANQSQCVNPPIRQVLCGNDAEERFRMCIGGQVCPSVPIERKDIFMKYYQKKLFGLLGAACVITAIGTGAFTVSATTVNDVIAHAYAVGLPESQIQQCINQYGGGTYTSEQCDQAIELLDQWAAERDQAIQDTVDQAAGNGTSGTTTSANQATENGSQSITTSTRPTEQEFIQMPLKDKVSYINSLPEKERTEFINQMSNEERNSFLKELDTDKQLSIISSLIDIGDAFDVSFSVDTVSEDGIAISARDANGNLIDVTTFGNTVEETGIPYTVPILAGGSAILLAAAGIGVLVYRSGRKQ